MLVLFRDMGAFVRPDYSMGAAFGRAGLRLLTLGRPPFTLRLG